MRWEARSQTASLSVRDERFTILLFGLHCVTDRGSRDQGNGGRRQWDKAVNGAFGASENCPQPKLPGKFENPLVTADGSRRARVDLVKQSTLWFNTGTLCNIACLNCFIESTPQNDRLAYITADEVADYLQQLKTRRWTVTEIGFTGGEPFMNPQIIDMVKLCLAMEYEVLVLSNAMRPMMRPRIQAGLREIGKEWPDKFRIRVSLDHYSAARHDHERGEGTFAISLKGMDWLRDNGIRMAVAGRTIWGEREHDTRRGYAALYAEHGYPIDPDDPSATVLFPEIEPAVDTPEITTECWQILGVPPGRYDVRVLTHGGETQGRSAPVSGRLHTASLRSTVRAWAHFAGSGKVGLAESPELRPVLCARRGVVQPQMNVPSISVPGVCQHLHDCAGFNLGRHKRIADGAREHKAPPSANYLLVLFHEAHQFIVRGHLAVEVCKSGLHSKASEIARDPRCVCRLAVAQKA